MAKKSFDERVVTFYQEEFVSQSDLIFRVAYALSLSIDQAHQIVAKSFEEAVATLDGRLNEGQTEIKSSLLKSAWESFQEVSGGKRDGEKHDSALAKALAEIAPDERGALTMVDLAGLSGPEAASTLGVEEKVLRQQLASARRTLMMSSLEY